MKKCILIAGVALFILLMVLITSIEESIMPSRVFKGDIVFTKDGKIHTITTDSIAFNKDCFAISIKGMRLLKNPVQKISIEGDACH